MTEILKLKKIIWIIIVVLLAVLIFGTSIINFANHSASTSSHTRTSKIRKHKKQSYNPYLAWNGQLYNVPNKPNVYQKQAINLYNYELRKYNCDYIKTSNFDINTTKKLDNSKVENTHAVDRLVNNSFASNVRSNLINRINNDRRRNHLKPLLVDNNNSRIR